MAKSYAPYQQKNTRRVSDWITGVCIETSGACLTQRCRVDRPMPGIIILVHGVNDVGEAFATQEQGIIAGLCQRLGRNDMVAHEWQDAIISHYGHRDKATGVFHNVRSPVIPFYWGYRPVDHATWIKDQQRYAAEIDKLNAILPYDSYVENDPQKQREFGVLMEKLLASYDVDCFGNVLMPDQARGGGPFANATTNIPDMLGPGFDGIIQDAAAYFSTNHFFNNGDYTHAIYENPHRIYQFFAAQRLADIILDIRRERALENDTINIVAHSQGTILTMLANMLVKQQGFNPADCVIFNNSPYSLTDSFVENRSAGQHQSSYAREQTFKNFCALMATNKHYSQQEWHDEAYTKNLTNSCCISLNSDWRNNPRSRRNNFGKVYNYFCPSDGVVSYRNIQGVGWRGIPESVANQITNLRQRVFYEGARIGRSPSLFAFKHPPSWGEGHYQDPLNVNYTFHDVVANGETLPESFTFHLMGADNHPKPYFQPVTGRDQVFAFAAKAKALSRTMSEVIYIPEGLKLTIPYQVGFQLSSPSLAKLSHYLGSKVISAKTMGHYVVEQLLIVRERPAEQLAAEWSRNPLIPISQHSSIVLNQHVSQCCVAYDLAIGQCEAFYHEQGKFWYKLVLKADWRNKDNGDTNTRRYYREGTLPDHETKRYMYRPDDVLPKGKFGVVNEYTASKHGRYDKRTQRYIPIVEEKEITSALGNITIGKNAVHDLPQWEWPKPLTPQQIQKELVAERLRTPIKDQELP